MEVDEKGAIRTMELDSHVAPDRAVAKQLGIKGRAHKKIWIWAVILPGNRSVETPIHPSHRGLSACRGGPKRSCCWSNDLGIALAGSDTEDGKKGREGIGHWDTWGGGRIEMYAIGEEPLVDRCAVSSNCSLCNIGHEIFFHFLKARTSSVESTNHSPSLRFSAKRPCQ